MKSPNITGGKFDLIFTYCRTIKAFYILKKKRKLLIVLSFCHTHT